MTFQIKKIINLIFPVIFLAVFFFFINSALAYKPSDPLFEDQDYLNQINVREAWDLSTGKGVIVAVIDSGVDLDHPDLRSNIWINLDEIAGDGIDNDKNGYIDDVNGWDFIDDDNSPVPNISGDYDSSAVGHGTAVSGIISAGENNKGIVGIAFQSKIMSLRILDNNGEGDVSNVIQAIKYAVNNGANIINLSFVGYDGSKEFEDIMAWASSRGVLVVAAAGNDDENLEKKPAYPACYHGVLAVSSVDDQDRKSCFSNYGGCVRIASPGSNLYSTFFQDDNEEEFLSGYENWFSGTSFASAVVSGVSALVKSKNNNLTPEQIISILAGSTDNINSQNSQYQNLLGGRINATSALNFEITSKSRIVKLADNSAVYYIDDSNLRHLFPTATVFWSWYQGSWSNQNIEIITRAEFESFLVGSNITVRPGTELIRFKDRKNIYVVLPENKICKVKYNIFNREPKVIPVGFESDYTLDRDCLIERDSLYPNGSLIRYSDSNNIYYIENGKKRELLLDSFFANNFNYQYIIDDVDFDISYPTGLEINYWEELVYPYL